MAEIQWKNELKEKLNNFKKENGYTNSQILVIMRVMQIPLETLKKDIVCDVCKVGNRWAVKLKKNKVKYYDNELLAYQMSKLKSIL